ncbi:hypothetical protein AX16_003825 [Volvariella volvacea WC 439]|nr:hypothetical protein AX16_003825 [Volvariella volvacea WC 439]
MLLLRTAVVTAVHLVLTWWFSFETGVFLSSLLGPALLEFNFARLDEYALPWVSSRPRHISSFDISTDDNATGDSRVPIVLSQGTLIFGNSTAAGTPVPLSVQLSIAPPERTPQIYHGLIPKTLQQIDKPRESNQQRDPLRADTPAPLVARRTMSTDPPEWQSLDQWLLHQRGSAIESTLIPSKSSAFGFEFDFFNFLPIQVRLILFNIVLSYLGYQILKRLLTILVLHVHRFLAELFFFRAPGILESMSFSSTNSLAMLAGTNYVLGSPQDDNAPQVGEDAPHAPLARYWFDPPTVVRMDEAPRAEGSPLLDTEGPDPQHSHAPSLADSVPSPVLPRDRKLVFISNSRGPRIALIPIKKQSGESLGTDTQAPEEPIATGGVTTNDASIPEIVFSPPSIPPSDSEIQDSNSWEENSEANRAMCFDTPPFLSAYTRNSSHGYGSLDSLDLDGIQPQPHDEDPHWEEHAEPQHSTTYQSLSSVDNGGADDTCVVEEDVLKVIGGELDEIVLYQRQGKKTDENSYNDNAQDADADAGIEFIDLTNIEANEYPCASSSSHSLKNEYNNGYRGTPPRDSRWASPVNEQVYPTVSGPWRYYPTQPWPSYALPVPVPVPFPLTAQAPPQPTWNPNMPVPDQHYGFGFPGASIPVPPTSAQTHPAASREGVLDSASLFEGEFVCDRPYRRYSNYGYPSERSWVADVTQQASEGQDHGPPELAAASHSGGWGTSLNGMRSHGLRGSASSPCMSCPPVTPKKGRHGGRDGWKARGKGRGEALGASTK